MVFESNYNNAICIPYFMLSQVSGLLERVEATFIKHFAKSNRREGMKLLRPKQKTEKHCITFFSGEERLLPE